MDFIKALFTVEYVKELLGLFFGGGAVFLYRVWKESRKNKPFDEETKITQMLNAVHEIYGLLNLCISQSPADQAVLIKVEDSGSVPQPGKALFLSVLYEVFYGNSNALRKKWMKEPLDVHYVDLIVSLTQARKAHLKRADVPTGSLMADFMAANGIEQVLLYDIYAEENAYYFLLVCVFDNTEVTLGEKDLLRSVSTGIKNMFLDHKGFNIGRVTK